MKLKLIIFLPVVQVILAVAMLFVGSKQVPKVSQDYPPFVAPAVKVCEAINAPASLLAVGLKIFSEKINVPGAGNRRFWDICFLLSIAILWLLVGWELQSNLGNRAATTKRFVLNAIGIGIAIFFAYFGLVALRQDERMLAWGSFGWSFALVSFYGLLLVRGTKKMLFGISRDVVN